jgi:4-hydroxy-4-methyl-2-oxoglutarate aldolase
MKAEIINLIQRNRISSVEVSDALHKTGVVPGISALNKGHFAAGRVCYIYAHSGSNWPIHEQIRIDLSDAIVFVDAFDCDGKAIFGDIVAKHLFLYKKAKAIVVNGFMRDAHRLRKEDYPIWCTGVTPLGCSNVNEQTPAKVLELAETNRRRFENSVMVCDDSGVTMIEENALNTATFDRLEFIELQEDIWYFCLDTLKWDTYDTICRKRYLTEPEVLPVAIRERLLKYVADNT